MINETKGITQEDIDASFKLPIIYENKKESELLECVGCSMVILILSLSFCMVSFGIYLIVGAV
jgi:hypothetical protein